MASAREVFFLMSPNHSDRDPLYMTSPYHGCTSRVCRVHCLRGPTVCFDESIEVKKTMVLLTYVIVDML